MRGKVCNEKIIVQVKGKGIKPRMIEDTFDYGYGKIDWCPQEMAYAVTEGYANMSAWINKDFGLECLCDISPDVTIKEIYVGYDQHGNRAYKNVYPYQRYESEPYEPAVTDNSHSEQDDSEIMRILEEFFRNRKKQEPFFNPIMGKDIDWGKMAEPMKGPIPGCCYTRKHVIYAIRHPNKALPMTRGDCTYFTALGMRPVNPSMMSEDDD